MDDFAQMLEEFSLQQDIIQLSYVDDTTLQWLYQHCFAFIYPSGSLKGSVCPFWRR